MSYSHSFSPEFYFDEGEPYDAPSKKTKRPTSLWQAIENMPRDQWRTMAREIFRVDPKFLTPETVLEAAQATNTVSNLNSPVEVWIDPDGYYRVKVYDR